MDDEEEVNFIFATAPHTINLQEQQLALTKNPKKIENYKNFIKEGDISY